MKLLRMPLYQPFGKVVKPKNSFLPLNPFTKNLTNSLKKEIYKRY
jgi:hypothetical protein